MSMAHSRSSFRLLDLPLELQQNVFSKVYEGSFSLKAQRASPPGHPWLTIGISWFGSPPLALCLANRHVFQQALPFYRNSFTAMDVSETHEIRIGHVLDRHERAWVYPLIKELVVPQAEGAPCSQILSAPLQSLQKVEFLIDWEDWPLHAADFAMDEYADTLLKSFDISKSFLEARPDPACIDHRTCELLSSVKLKSTVRTMLKSGSGTDKAIRLVSPPMLVPLSPS